MEKNLEKLFKLLLKDIKVELDDEFHLNFQRKAFFTHSWKQARYNQTGSLLIRTGALRKSLASSISGQNSIRWTSSLPYAQLPTRPKSGGKGGNRRAIYSTNKIQETFAGEYQSRQKRLGRQPSRSESHC